MKYLIILISICFGLLTGCAERSVYYSESYYPDVNPVYSYSYPYYNYPYSLDNNVYDHPYYYNNFYNTALLSSMIGLGINSYNYHSYYHNYHWNNFNGFRGYNGFGYHGFGGFHFHH